MTIAADPLLSRWRIVSADLWDRDHLDLCGPAALVIRPNSDGEIAFGALQASLDTMDRTDPMSAAVSGVVSGASSPIEVRSGSIE